MPQLVDILLFTVFESTHSGFQSTTPLSPWKTRSTVDNPTISVDMHDNTFIALKKKKLG